MKKDLEIQLISEALSNMIAENPEPAGSSRDLDLQLHKKLNKMADELSSKTKDENRLSRILLAFILEEYLEDKITMDVTNALVKALGQGV